MNLRVDRIADQIEGVGGWAVAVEFSEIGICAAAEGGSRREIGEMDAGECYRLGRRAGFALAEDEPAGDDRTPFLQKQAQPGQLSRRVFAQM